MRSVAQHRAAVLALVAPLAPVRVGVGAARGLVLAEDVVAAVDLPGFDNSAMDGYAVRAADCAGASDEAPVRLPVDGDIPAGDTRRHVLGPGRALRIMTGAPLPEGCDAVVPVELTDGGQARVALRLCPEVGRHVRRRGEDVQRGRTVLREGVALGPGHVALAAAANVAQVSVRRRPRVTVVSTGDELVPVGHALEHGQIVDSNHLMLCALVEAAGAEVAAGVHLPDDADAVRAFLAAPDGDPDLVITSGGVSMGVYDTVKEVLAADGGVEFVKVAMRPGMPQGCGTLAASGVPVLTLPGNPVSSYVSFHVFVLPALRRLAGRDPEADGSFTAVAGAAWPTAPGRAEMTRVVEDGDRVRPSGGQGSHVLGALAEATALAMVPADVESVEAGMSLRCLPLLGHHRGCG
ncbi:molybdopterin molybdotransferase MoeA [Phycicoccus endophyticus]|uniref:Molybdopterin molybdenumtransferase n=1 Tax=Phycicoccus endophyticus TaxID=1690220 RepID=A0A7G9R2B8_9MICO|nr:gephyrin-like molybdotransferase Glp [Phycicoccus endophyticus]NHI19585.1 molybdopterin molybdotransferase MoeA [Phycicoccus endophyticus]QNN49743.1 molybdopterin molybdotransferase MoeA [Phycicoccus endophyticus]GGL34728.1 putative molybdopterin biosynthesis protein MoeA [Phycicoccus endophyticus]